MSNDAETVRIRLVVAYDGTDLAGFAATPGARTVVSELGAALSLVARVPVKLTGAGRTDAGVHGWGQVVSCDVPTSLDVANLPGRLSKLLAPAIAVRSAEVVADDFDARFSARWRHYRYDIWNSPAPNPLLAGHTWWVRQPIDQTVVRAEADELVGEHDFSSFCRPPKQPAGARPKSLVRRVMLTRWSRVETDGPGNGKLNGDDVRLRFEIRANAFCHQMVRSLVGTLVDLGCGRLGTATMAEILRTGDRGAAGRVAPPSGLTLWEVGYRDPGSDDHGPDGPG